MLAYFKPAWAAERDELGRDLWFNMDVRENERWETEAVYVGWVRRAWSGLAKVAFQHRERGWRALSFE